MTFSFGTILMPVLAIVVIIVSSVLHELAHGFVAYKLGDDTAKEAGRLTLNPIKHIDPYMSIVVPAVLFLLNAPVIGGAKPVPVNRHRLKGGAWGMALVAFCGPLTNLIIAFVAFLVQTLTGMVVKTGEGITYSSWVAQDGFLTFVAILLMMFVMYNIVLAVFNLLPIPPLDGSRILYALAPDGVRELMDKIEPYSMIIVFAIVLVFNGALATLLSGVVNAIYDFFYLLVGLA